MPTLNLIFRSGQSSLWMRLLASSGGCDCQLQRTFGSGVDQFAVAFSASCDPVYVRYAGGEQSCWRRRDLHADRDRSGSLWETRSLRAYGLWLQPGRPESPRRSAGSCDVAEYRLARVAAVGSRRSSASDYNFGYPMQAQAAGITFIGGTTATALFRDEFPAASTFNAVVSCDATGQPVFHAAMKFYRASLASPAYRQYIIGIGEIQIDGGVDGLFFDELDFSYQGSTSGNEDNGDEGFDDANIADFGGFLCGKYPKYSPAEWQSKYGITTADNLNCSKSAATRGRTVQLSWLPGAQRMAGIASQSIESAGGGVGNDNRRPSGATERDIHRNLHQPGLLAGYCADAA